MVEALEKKSFSVAGKIRERSLAKSGCCGVFFKNGTKESILHNLKLWAIMPLVLHVRELADWRATFCVGNLTIISIM